ncbi:hypothetical protein [Micromonospora fulviviridis]|uniref:hypothetical protein n=1 Tax=Micromonospora fulviviridis TaxID=47860 RepID=UPI00379D5F94
MTAASRSATRRAPRPLPRAFDLSLRVEVALHALLGVDPAVRLSGLHGVDPTHVWTGPARPRVRVIRPPARATVAGSDGPVSLEVTGPGRPACAVALVGAQPSAEWDRRLGGHALLAQEAAALTGESHAGAAHRADTALRCLEQLRLPRWLPLAVDPTPVAAWLAFRSGTVRVATVVLAGAVLAVLTDEWS